MPTLKELIKQYKEEYGIETYDYTFGSKEEGKIVLLIYGNKGEGKSTAAFSLPGKKLVLNFDRKADRTKENMFSGDESIDIFDAMRYLKENFEDFIPTSVLTYDYIKSFLADLEEGEYDWIIFDGSEVEMQICEMVMRGHNGKMPFEGIENRNLWKERKLYARQLHRLALGKAKMGVVYTAYTDKDRVVRDGELVTEKDIPKWTDIIMWETDIVIRVWSTLGDGKRMKFYLRVDTSKRDDIAKTGMVKEWTGASLASLLNFPEEEEHVVPEETEKTVEKRKKRKTKKKEKKDEKKEEPETVVEEPKPKTVKQEKIVEEEDDEEDDDWL